MSRATEPIACRLTDAAQAQRLAALRGTLFATVEAVEEERDSVAFSFAGTDARLRQLLDFVAFERACCPFLTYTLSGEPGHGTLHLRLGGSAAARQFVEEAFLPLLPDHLRLEAGTP